MTKKYGRLVGNMEKCFRVHMESTDVDELSFRQIKEWLNSNTKNGVTSARLANLLRKRKQFVYQRTERKVGTNVTISYWALDGVDTSPKEPGCGWVVVKEK